MQILTIPGQNMEDFLARLCTGEKEELLASVSVPPIGCIGQMSPYEIQPIFNSYKGEQARILIEVEAAHEKQDSLCLVVTV